MELSLPDEGGAGHRFYDILEDETKMSAVFEHFVRNFFRLEQNHYTVAAEMIPWPARCANARDADYLPMMITDVTLRSADRTIVIDAKYYRDTFVSRFGTRPKVRSVHLYQLQSYLTNMERHSGQIAPEGVLLYPSIDGEEVRLDFQLPQHRIRVWTVDMARPWQHVHHRLLELADAPRH
jgi:5-methylcytosine-specific restriction enzyme subunit McrC